MLAAGEHYARDSRDHRRVGHDHLAREQVAELRRGRLHAAILASSVTLRRLKSSGRRLVSFVHLHTHTEYSLLDGAARVKALVKQRSRLRDARAGDHRPRRTCTAPSTSTRRRPRQTSSRSSAVRSTSRPATASSGRASPTSTTCCCSPRTTRATATSWRSSSTRRSRATTTSRRSTWSCCDATRRGSSARRRA